MTAAELANYVNMRRNNNDDEPVDEDEDNDEERRVRVSSLKTKGGTPPKYGQLLPLTSHVAQSNRLILYKFKNNSSFCTIVK